MYFCMNLKVLLFSVITIIGVESKEKQTFKKVCASIFSPGSLQPSPSFQSHRLGWNEFENFPLFLFT